MFGNDDLGVGDLFVGHLHHEYGPETDDLEAGAAHLWSAPRTWVTSELVTSTIMNAHVRDQLDFLGYAYDSVLGADAASFDVTTGLSYGSAWELTLLARGTQAAQTIDVRIRFNNDSGANYDTYVSYFQGTTQVFGPATNGAASGFLCYIPAASATASKAGTARAQIMSPLATTFHKEALSHFGSPTMPTSNDNGHGTAETSWASTAAITRVTVFPSAGNFLAGSRLSIRRFAPDS